MGYVAKLKKQVELRLIEILAHLLKEALVTLSWVGFEVFRLTKLAQYLLFVAGEILRCPNIDVYQQVTLVT